MEKQQVLVFSSRNVEVVNVQVSSDATAAHIRQQRKEAVIMIETRNSRLKIRDYNNQFNP